MSNSFILDRRPIQSMQCARMYCSATPFNGEIYAAGNLSTDPSFMSSCAKLFLTFPITILSGGVDESNCLNSIEKYDPKTGMWVSFSSLPRMMCGSGMQVLDSVPLTLAHPSRKRKALYVDTGAGSVVPKSPVDTYIDGSDVFTTADDEAEGFDEAATGDIVESSIATMSRTNL